MKNYNPTYEKENVETECSHDCLNCKFHTRKEGFDQQWGMFKFMYFSCEKGHDVAFHVKSDCCDFEEGENTLIYMTDRKKKKYDQYYLSLKQIEKGEMDSMTGYEKVAVVNLLNDYNKKDYEFALFTDAKEGDLVVCNPLNTYELGKVVSVLITEEYGKSVTKEVISVVDMAAYETRVAERENQKKIADEKKKIQKELDAKISRLKDLEFYERMAKELGDKDPEIKKMVEDLKELGM